MNTWEAAITIVGLALVTVLTRSLLLLPREEVPMPAWVKRALKYAPLAALVAIVVPEVLLTRGVLIATLTGLTLQPGDMVVELRTPGASKGDSIRAFMTEQPFRGHQPIFLGDDLTDEHGFFAVRQLGGYGILVGPDRKTTATYRMEGVEAALTWLEAAE